MTSNQPDRISRRAALRTWIALSAPLVLVAACGRPRASAITNAFAAQQTGTTGQSEPVPGSASVAQIGSTPSCVVTPRQTEGPYFVDERLNRSDIRSDPSDGSIVEGVPLRLVMQVSQVSGDACSAVVGAFVDVWQCDALGNYSDERDMNGQFDSRGKKFLRGYQVTDANGAVEFTTIYPGWYQGRTVHIHFKVRTALETGAGRELTSQLYFDDQLTDQVHAQLPYSTKGQRTMRNAQDGIYRNGGSQLTLALEPHGAGYAGTFHIGLQLS